MFGRNHQRLVGGKQYPFWIFIAPIALLIGAGFPLLTRHPVPIAMAMVSLVIVLVPIALHAVYGSFIVDRHVQEHDFQLWKKSKSASLKDRSEAWEAILSMCRRTPYLEKHLRYTDRLAFILLSIWTLIFLGAFLYILLSYL